MSKKVLVVGCQSYYDPHVSFGTYTGDIKLLEKDPASVRLVVFIGGADINPKLYGHEKFELTGCSDACDNRDIAVFNSAQANHVPCAGICRGGQFLTVMAGGHLIQHVSGHGCSHSMTTHTGKEMKVTSTHHQMFGWPLPEGAQLLGWATEKYAKKAYNQNKIYSSLLKTRWASCTEYAYEPAHVEPDYEPEIVYYPNINSLAAQYHPEMMDESTEGFKFYVEQVEKLLSNSF
ncbi:MAG: gamma-glutamyl-gamma-aminobutyrate hydrolase family protein [Candidatus Buchananbacteria bacterium]|jgi:carbamoylphosphate synthase small subunit